MSTNWNKKINEYYNKKDQINDSFNWIQLIDLVESQINDTIGEHKVSPDLHEADDQVFLEALDKYSEVCNVKLLSEDAENKKLSAGEKLILSLPKFIPNESWGNSKSESRKEIQKFVENIGGKTAAEKFQNFMKIQEPNSGIRSARRIISSIILLESLKAMLQSYSASSAGYVFEGFIAALMNGEQVTDPPKGSLPIEDVMAFTYGGSRPGIPLSLKLLKPGGQTKGSFRNLIDALFTPGSNGLAYVVVFKEGEEGMNLSVKEFTFTKENIVQVLMEGSGANWGLFTPTSSNLYYLRKEALEIGNKELARVAGTLIQSENRTSSLINAQRRISSENFYEVLKTTKGYSHESDTYYEGVIQEEKAKTQWYVNASFFDYDWAFVKTIDHGRLKVSDEAILNTVNLYIKVLENIVTTLFSAVSSLSENINEYFVSAKRDKAIRNGREAVANTEEIQKSLGEEEALRENFKDK